MGNFPRTLEHLEQPLNNQTIKNHLIFFNRSGDAEVICSPKYSNRSRDYHRSSCSSVCHWCDIHSHSSEKEVSGLWVSWVGAHCNHPFQSLPATRGPALWEPSNQSQLGPRTQKSPQLGLISYYHSLKILNKDPAFSCCIRPPNYTRVVLVF